MLILIIYHFTYSKKPLTFTHLESFEFTVILIEKYNNKNSTIYLTMLFQGNSNTNLSKHSKWSTFFYHLISF